MKSTVGMIHGIQMLIYCKQLQDCTRSGVCVHYILYIRIERKTIGIAMAHEHQVQKSTEFKRTKCFMGNSFIAKCSESVLLGSLANSDQILILLSATILFIGSIEL